MPIALLRHAQRQAADVPVLLLVSAEFPVHG